ncbi:DUF6516 family protein [Fulvimarina sp. MAC8]|uniref:toxin-antitoxin system TumE family protein n=1 Tax=Fulvimarina sp. MAC8 TaxID=3162874 RepID=UPI0032EF7A0D
MAKRGAKAKLLLRERRVLTEELFVELVVWRVPRSLHGSDHDLKYRLALVFRGVCVLRYDNEAGKGDHRHTMSGEQPYRFVDAERLIEDFWMEVAEWRRQSDI